MWIPNVIKKDVARYNASALALLFSVTVMAAGVISKGVEQLVANTAGLTLLACLTVLAAVTSSRYPLYFKKSLTGVSVQHLTDAIVFLAMITVGPYEAALLVTVDMFIFIKRLGFKPSSYLFNISHNVISACVGGKVYFFTAGLLRGNLAVGGLSQSLLEFALPLIAMALSYYAVQLTIVSLIAKLVYRNQVRDVLSGKLPWEPLTFIISAMAAGLVGYVPSHFGIVTTLVTLVLALPLPVLIYYMFRNYRDKIDEKDKHFKELTEINDSILEMLAMAIDAKDQTTHDHIQRTKLFAKRMGEMVGLSQIEIEAVKAGALLHDIGKIGVPAYILNKPGKLTEHEFEQMKMHTIIGADMLSNIKFRYPVVPIVRHHHERWDGRGYPDGLKGEEIPVTARILTLVDTYDALRSDRPYHKAMSREQALEYLNSNAGVFFDPNLVRVFLSSVDELEQEASTFKAPQMRKHSGVNIGALKSAKPAAGLDTSAEPDRASAAIRRVSDSNQKVADLYEMARTLASSLSLEDTSAIVTNRLAKLVPFTTCALALFDSTRSEFEVVHSAGRYTNKFMRHKQPISAGITGWVIQNQRPMYNTNPMLDLGFLGSESAAEYKSVMVFPLLKNKDAIGAIAFYSTELERYESEHIQMVESISQPVSDAIFNAIAFESAKKTAITDPMTGFANMSAFLANFEREQARSRRSGLPVSLLVAVLDREPAAARASGAVDDALVAVGLAIKERLREVDLIARQSADTLIILLSESGPDEAAEVMTRVREAAAKLVALAVSFGTSTSQHDGETLDELIMAARIRCVPDHDSVGTSHISTSQRVVGARPN